MKLYVIFTPSHRNLYENYFLKSVPDEFEIIPCEIPQECPTGEFYKEGWDKTCYKKIELYEKACAENQGELFLFSDVDIQFFGKIKDTLIEELGDYDIACQNDTAHYYCSGFWICRGNERTLNMFSEMKKNYQSEDQTTMNRHIHLCKSKFLSNKFFTVGHILSTVWSGQDFKIDYPILMHHANWVSGIDNKIKILDYVKRLINTDYQHHLFEVFKDYRSSPKYPTYPPYHEGLYLEDFFCDFIVKNNIKTDRYYIPVFWTTCYVDNCFNGLQEILNTLDRTKKYFTVAQHDDAIREKLPPDTICFNAGGNGGGIPIPLICSPIKDELKPKLNKDIFCSFVGSLTHPIRNMMYQVLYNNPKYLLSVRNWTSSVGDSDLNNFINITSRSVFSLCPRGYGRSSFRLYETMQLGTIPVFIYDQKWCPFEDEIDWNEFSVLIDVNNIHNIDMILSNYTQERIKQMQNNLYNYWIKNFTMQSVCEKIIHKI